MKQIEVANIATAQIVLPTPFLKWAGGKRWLSNRIVELAHPLHGKYIEPFLGGGAVFFALRPAQAILSDANFELINTYQAIKDSPEKIAHLLRDHQRHHSKEYYYKMRSYKPRCEFRMAARFIYLNRTCWNGLYRVNLSGKFNVPIGTKSAVMMATDDWQAMSDFLKSAKLICGDFENSIDAAKEGDFVFADPPYTVKHNLNGFIKYNDALFSWSDQIRLRDALLRARQRGVRVVVTNAHHSSIRDLYSEHFLLEPVARASVLAGSSVHRGRYEELLIC
ncbi:MAG: Dam family site-specific DNA-(adenine-N6)-methyltransferase [Gallionella sp.]|nr:Dam family site-specific DNA-(adenine-N6)-methyltransferase [Gallionella sp.]